MEPQLLIAPQFKGSITFHDLLSSEGTLTFTTNQISTKHDGLVFRLVSDSYNLQLAFGNESIIFQRNGAVSVCTLSDLKKVSEKLRVILIWTYDSLVIDCGYSYDARKVIKIETEPFVPPADLIRWARLHDLLHKVKYVSELELRNTVYSLLQTVNMKISESDSYKSYWNITYEGNRIVSKEPKRETEIQPLIHSMLSDICLVNGLDVIPEYKTGQGNIDFAFMGYVENIGNRKICVEFKLAHSKDLEHGLVVQLPAYMRVCGSQFGAYCVLNYYSNDEQLCKYDGTHIDFYLSRIADTNGNPILKDIRIFIFEFIKPLTASVL